MWDGDGSIILSDNVLSLSLSQAYPELLIKIRNEFGGKIYKGKSKDNHKQIYGYRICDKECIPLLKILEKNCIIKYNQVKLAMEFIQYIDVEGTSELKNKLCEKNCELNKHNHDLEKPYERLCDEYIAGLFDAEGCIAVKNKSLTINYIKITQTNDVEILYMIKEYFDFGDVIDDEKWCIGRKNEWLYFLKTIEEFLIVKKEQVEYAIKYIEEDKKETKNELILKLQEAKHRSENIDKQILDKYNVEDTIKKTNSKNLSVIMNSLVNKKENWNVGEDNPNHGKKLSEEIKEKMGKSISLSKKRKLSDEDIDKIRDLKNSGKKQIDIAKEYGVNREIIRRIWNNTMIKKSEIREGKKADKKEFSNVSPVLRMSIGKRKVIFEVAIQIMIKKGYDYSTEIVKDFVGKGRDGMNVSIDTIKNLWSGKTKLYDFEFNEESEITYEKYLEIIKMKLPKKKSEYLKYC